jgi:hypothetical protein
MATKIVAQLCSDSASSALSSRGRARAGHHDEDDEDRQGSARSWAA